MQINNIKSLMITILTVLPGLCTQAQQVKVKQPNAGIARTWRLLGTVEAKLTADHDKILVAGPYDYFRRLKFKVTNAPLNIEHMVVTYQDGGLPERIDIRFNIPQGGESRIIDLKEGKRKLRTVEFWYKTSSLFKGRANLTLFGIK
jgi:hypothetical protein